jgi:hypothetical protein
VNIEPQANTRAPVDANWTTDVRRDLRAAGALPIEGLQRDVQPIPVVLATKRTRMLELIDCPRDCLTLRPDHLPE